jgi:hypothetical protein
MRLEVHLRVEDHKLLLQAFAVRTQKMVFPEMNFERVIVDVVLLFSTTIASIANVAAFVLVSAVRV